MAITDSAFEKNLYKLLDQVIETGEPLETQRNDSSLTLYLSDPKSKLASLKKRDAIIGDPESLVHIDWLSEQEK